MSLSGSWPALQGAGPFFSRARYPRSAVRFEDSARSRIAADRKVRRPILLRLGGVLLALMAVSMGCRSMPRQTSITPLQRYRFMHPAMGTFFTVTLYAPDQASAETAADLAFRRIDALEDIMSDYQADSELNLLREQPVRKPVPVSKDLFDVLLRAQTVSRISDGAFDVTVGPFVRLWRFARKRKVLPTEREIDAARQAVGWQKLRLDAKTHTVTLRAPRMQLDVGGIAKGYAADAALQLLRERGLPWALVAASGDIAVGDPPPGYSFWRVGLSEIGSRSNAVASVVLLRNAAVSTSGDAEQFIEINGVRYSHIVSPVTGLGLTERIQVSVIAPNATASDSLATAVSVLGLKRGLELIERQRDTAALIVTEEGGQVHAHPSRRFGKYLLDQRRSEFLTPKEPIK